MTIEAVSVTDFGTLLRNFRSRAHLTQNELAGLSAVSARTIRNLEAGRAMSPRPDTVRLLADGLRLGADAQARLSLAAGQSPVGAALHAAQGQLPSWDAAHDPDPYGREQDLRSVMSCIHTGTSCLVSISGFGGVGKSRLATALVREAEHTLRIPWLWLRADEPATSTASPVGTAFRQWHRELQDGQPDAVEDLAQMVGDQQYLIIVDGVDGPAHRLESTLRDLLRRCPRLTVIETTRRPLSMDGRHVVPLKPLRLPTAEEASTESALIDHPALQLMVPMIRATQPEFEESPENLRHAMDVCRSLDGMPRALEAAAKWFTFYSPSAVADAAREDPCAVAAPCPDESRPSWLRSAADDARGGLTDAQWSLLGELAVRPAPWTIHDLADGTDTPSVELMESLRTLLALGVIRPGDGSDTEDRTYTVLNLLRPMLV